MKQEQFVSIGMRIITVGGGILAARGVIPQSWLDLINQLSTTEAALLASLFIIVSGAYGVWKSSRDQQVKAVVSDGVTKVVTPTQTEADKQPSPLVVGPADVAVIPKP